MKRRTRLLIYPILFLSLSTFSRTFADAFPKTAKGLGGPVLSLEVLGSYELFTTERGSVLFWGGIAAVSAPFYGFEINGGPEAAIELRHYFAQKPGKSWAFSGYLGGAYSFISEKYGAITPGIKLTRKRSINQLLQMEPYISLSYPFYFDREFPFLPSLTFGLRIVFEKKGKT